jgi:hypothetical protein
MNDLNLRDIALTNWGFFTTVVGFDSCLSLRLELGSVVICETIVTH